MRAIFYVQDAERQRYCTLLVHLIVSRAECDGSNLFVMICTGCGKFRIVCVPSRQCEELRRENQYQQKFSISKMKGPQFAVEVETKDIPNHNVAHAAAKICTFIVAWASPSRISASESCSGSV